MELTKEWIELTDKIYNLIGINTLMDLEISIPSSLCSEYKEEYQKDRNKELSFCYIELTAISYCTGEKISKTIKIKFGNKQVIDYNKKEIIVEFKYATKILFYIIYTLQPSNLTIVTKNLKERKDIFSPPISTLG